MRLDGTNATLRYPYGCRERESPLYEELHARNAPILRMDTKDFGYVFGVTLSRYEVQMDYFGGRRGSYEGYPSAVFADEFYTDHAFWPSLAHRDALHKTEKPRGSGHAIDLIHQTLRSLGHRIATAITPASEKLIGEEARIRIEVPDRENGGFHVMKDRPPSTEAIAALERVESFAVQMRDNQGKIHTITVQNDPTEDLKRIHCVLETALALREQARDLFARPYPVFHWVRECVSLQSVSTMLQVAAILERGIQRSCPEKAIADFGLTVPMKSRLRIAEAIVQCIEDIRREYAIDTIAYSSDDRGRPNLLAHIVGESSHGFTPKTPLETAAVTYAMHTSGTHLRFHTGYNGHKARRWQFPRQLSLQIIDTANRIAEMASMDNVADTLRSSDGLFIRAREWWRRKTKRIASPAISQQCGINQAYDLLHHVIDTQEDT